MEVYLFTSFSHRQCGRAPSSHSHLVFQGTKKKDVGPIMNPILRPYWPVYATTQAYPCLVIRKKELDDVTWASVAFALDFTWSVSSGIKATVSICCLHSGIRRVVENMEHILEPY